MTISLDITKKYFDLSNQGDLLAIEKMFQTDATYSSANTGLYYGVHEIMSMMTAFFASHQKLHWQIHRIKQLNEHTSEVEFSCEAVNNAGEIQNFSGIERVIVDQGQIRHIEIR